MSEEALPRPRRGRRALVAVGRAVALLVLVTGIHGALVIAVPRLLPVPRYVIALVAGVAIFEMLRPGRRPSSGAPEASGLEEAQRVIDSLRAETDQMREQLGHDAAAMAELNQETAKARAEAEEQARLRAAEADQARAREAQIREQYEAESEHVQSAASKALEEIQRTRAASDELRGQADRERDRARRLESQLADFDKRLATALQELDGVRGERQRVRAELEDALERSVAEKTTLRKTLEEEWGAKLQKIVNELASDHENDIGEALAAREEARAEVRTLTARVLELQQQVQSAQQTLNANDALALQLEEERQRFHQELEEQKKALQLQLETEWGAKLHHIVSGLASDHEDTLGDAIATREAARAEVRALTPRIEELLSALDRERQLSRDLAETRRQLEEEKKTLREQMDNEWSAKLQKIVTELTMDHENDIGDAIAAREAARAEARSLNLRVLELEKQLQNAREGRFGLLQRDEEVTQKMEAERQARAALEEENSALKSRLESARERMDAEWSDKLQTIVNHLTTDHEADVGKAIEEREAARAETRNLAIKVSSLQQKIDSDRKSFASAQEEWSAKLRQTEEELQALRAPEPAPPAVEPEPFAPDEEEERRARAEVLEFAEQAHEALRRVTSPGDVPVPSEERRPRVLFVHHDPALRTMWRDNLDKNGFNVQTAADGLEGLRLAKAEKPDVVIADVSMPKMDGRELCQLIKSNPETAGVKVLLLTGIYTNEVPTPSGQQEFEADDVLRKPVKVETMKSALSNLLAARV